MVVLDTNVVSEPMKPIPNRIFINWLDRHGPETLYLTTTSLAELLVGIEAMLAGKRRDGFQTSFADLLRRLFGPRILAFDTPSAFRFASLVAKAQSAGHTVSMADGQIAAIAATAGFIVATRDTILSLPAALP
jgi:predicted nucleic acid-binding protein